MSNYTVIVNGLFINTIPQEAEVDKGLLKKIEDVFKEVKFKERQMIIHTGPEGERQIREALRAELNTEASRLQEVPQPVITSTMSANQMIQYLDTISEQDV
jgi:hypothetical protein